jgi:hypothetical protein
LGWSDLAAGRSPPLTPGTIRANLVLNFKASQGKGTVTGGTGKYAGAKGTLVFKNLNKQGTRTSVALTLA